MTMCPWWPIGEWLTPPTSERGADPDMTVEQATHDTPAAAEELDQILTSQPKRRWRHRP